MPKVSDIFMNITTKPTIIDEDDGINVIHRMLLETDPISRCIYVVDKQLKLIGKITLQDLLKIVAVKRGITGNRHFSVRELFEYVSKDIKAKNITVPPCSAS
ncbi:MAG: CBS domain-containing protein [Bacillota bacterium]